jgi:hypothetical protein
LDFDFNSGLNHDARYCAPRPTYQPAQPSSTVCPGPPVNPLPHPVTPAVRYGRATHNPPPFVGRRVVPLTTCTPSHASPHLCIKRVPAAAVHPLFFLSAPHASASKPPLPLLHVATTLIHSSALVSHCPCRICLNCTAGCLHGERSPARRLLQIKVPPHPFLPPSSCRTAPSSSPATEAPPLM